MFRKDIKCKGSMKSLLLNILLLTVCVKQVELSVPCTTPDGFSGTCVHLNACKPLQAINNKPRGAITLYEYILFMYSKCTVGKHYNQNTFCCTNHRSTATPSRPTKCYTSRGQFGMCTPLKSCQALDHKLNEPATQSNLAYVESLRCPGYNHYTVCCEESTTGLIDPRYSIVNEPMTKCLLSSSPPDPEGECCGYQSSDDDRIIGGLATTIDQYPWLVLIEYQKIATGTLEMACGGSLISGRYVLTASHCVKGSVLDKAIPVYHTHFHSINVRLGEYDISNPGPDCIPAPGGGEDCNDGPLTIPIQEIIPHEGYDPEDRNRHHDIALIRMREAAPYTDFIRPICLPTSDIAQNPEFNLRLFTSGWGFIENKFGIRSNVKLDVDLPYMTKSECKQQFEVINITITDRHLCAGGEKGKDACKGDSGGPLMTKTGHRYNIVGVVSFGPKPCGQENRPSVYTNVYEYLPWIREHIRP